jgi:hypothetical protein
MNSDISLGLEEENSKTYEKLKSFLDENKIQYTILEVTPYLLLIIKILII